MPTLQFAMCSDILDVGEKCGVVPAGTLLIDVSTWKVYVTTDNNNYSAVGVTAGAGVSHLSDLTGGVASLTMASITAGAAYAQADMVAVKNALASLNAYVNAIYTSLQNAGSIKAPPV